MFYDYIYALYMGTILYVLFLIISNINIKNRRLKRSQESQIRLYFAMMRPFHLSIVITNHLNVLRLRPKRTDQQCRHAGLPPSL